MAILAYFCCIGVCFYNSMSDTSASPSGVVAGSTVTSTNSLVHASSPYVLVRDRMLAALK